MSDVWSGAASTQDTAGHFVLHCCTVSCTSSPCLTRGSLVFVPVVELYLLNRYAFFFWGGGVNRVREKTRGNEMR